jgi:hypothetical protein
MISHPSSVGDSVYSDSASEPSLLRKAIGIPSSIAWPSQCCFKKAGWVRTGKERQKVRKSNLLTSLYYNLKESPPPGLKAPNLSQGAAAPGVGHWKNSPCGDLDAPNGDCSPSPLNGDGNAGEAAPNNPSSGVAIAAPGGTFGAETSSMNGFGGKI